MLQCFYSIFNVVLFCTLSIILFPVVSHANLWKMEMYPSTSAWKILPEFQRLHEKVLLLNPSDFAITLEICTILKLF